MIIVGVGNPYRGDDGAGWAVIDELEKMVDSKYLLKSQADVGELLDIFSRWPIVYIVDACLAKAMPGSWQRIDALQESIPQERAQTSTHGFSLSQTIDLAKALHQLPKQLIIYAITGKTYLLKDLLSTPIAQAIHPVAKEIFQEMQTCMKNSSSTI